MGVTDSELQCPSRRRSERATRRAVARGTDRGVGGVWTCTSHIQRTGCRLALVRTSRRWRDRRPDRVVGLGSTASAGGWAVSTLDAIPTPTPVNRSRSASRSGSTASRPSTSTRASASRSSSSPMESSRSSRPTQAGATGHYVATVVFPAAGDYTWAVQQGWFAEQDLGRLTVANGRSPVQPQPARRRPTTGSRPSPATGCLRWPRLFGAAAIADLVVGRRRRRTVVA